MTERSSFAGALRARLTHLREGLGVIGRGLPISLGLLLLLSLIAAALAFGFLRSAPPTTLVLTSGPKGSSFWNVAEQYRKILARDGVTLKVLPSQGSRDNLARLADAKQDVDVGFVVGGETAGRDTAHLVSLGSLSYQPLMVFYRGKPKALISEFKNERLDVGLEGSGASALAQALFDANGIKAGDGTQVGHRPAEESIQALKAGRIDALFAMSDSTPTALMRELLRDENIHLFNFVQAEGYAHRITYLNKLVMPRGAIDFGEDIPPESVQLIAPTVELVARDDLHPALSDLLLSAAREVHGRAGLFKKAGEFPAPQEHDFPISADATRFYASGRGFLYRSFPFWIASLIERVLAIVVPMTIILVPGFKIAPAVFRWRVVSRIYRWYAVLQRIERDADAGPLDAERCDALLARLEHVESTVMRLTVPPAFGDLLYGLRSHIAVVRASLQARRATV
ncbi:MAG TPA: TAXI family TRAP transporter solute-binding subunit [Burkholderiaceae bacterium]|nr:TAXI family TRAP transporter solute-binding subunit [Burkholderiaceae bacterium]